MKNCQEYALAIRFKENTPLETKERWLNTVYSVLKKRYHREKGKVEYILIDDRYSDEL